MDATVIIPFFNAQDTLARAINSVLAQQKVELEIILINNNSTDASESIARTYSKSHKKITVHSESKQGANYARNKGMLLAKYQWLQFLDADDQLLPNKIYNQLSIDNISDIDIISSPISEITITGDKINYEVDDLKDLWLSLLTGKIGWTCSNLWRKSALLEVGGWSTHYTSHQEQELMAKCIIENKKFYFYNVSECIVFEQENSISTRSDFAITGIKFMQFILHHLQSNGALTMQREKAIQNQLYHKYLRAFKINSEEAMNAMFNTRLNLDMIDKPLIHQFLISIFGVNNTFRILKWVANK